MRGLMAEEVGPGAIPADVHAEMVRQHRRFGPHASRERWITVMAEELGEIARAYLQESALSGCDHDGLGPVQGEVRGGWRAGRSSSPLTRTGG